METVKLNNGLTCPVIGIGTFMLSRHAGGQRSTAGIITQHHPGVVRLSDFRNRDFPAQPVSPAEHLPAASGLTRPTERHNM